MIDALKTDPRRRNLAILGIIAIVSILLAALGLWHQASMTGAKYQSETVFPHLPGRVRKVARIHIVSKAHGVLDISLSPQHGWVLPQHSNYPASYDQVQKTIIGIAALEAIEPATARPDWYGKIGVDAPPKGSGTLVTLYDDKGQTLASLIIGQGTDIGDSSGAVGLYARKPDDTQSWLVRSVFEPKSDAADWLDKTVIDVDRSRIQEVDVTPVTGPAFMARRDKPSDESFTLMGIPSGREINYAGAADPVASAITNFSFDDVRPATDFDFSDAPRLITHTFDGLTVTVKVVTQGADFWATVYAEGAPGKPMAEQEARAIDAHADGWAYKLPDDKGKLFMTTLDSLLKPVAAKK